ncbi:MAG: prolipoprotein diacylglyceryl transferase [Actinomycetota bacterium]|nr:prolipoprotein diacylglyceryl transferase [Actinomycetota bacterium]
MTVAILPMEIPSPTTGVWYLGPLPIRAYAICILAGIVVAVWIAQRRLESRGGTTGQVLDISAWAVPFGIVGGRIYHLITSPQAYFGEGGHPLNAVKIWEGGLGIWGAVALGALGAWIGCRRQGVRFLDFADAAAPGVLVAQALGRWGNYFNNEIHGAPTDLPWGLKVYQWDQQAGHAVVDPSGDPVVLGTFHPTFLYESIFCLLLALVLVRLDRRLELRRGQVFALYIAGYPVGRGVIELMRTDDANTIFGLRVNSWVSMLVFLLGVALFVWFGRRADPVEESLGDAEKPVPETLAGGVVPKSQHTE